MGFLNSPYKLLISLVRQMCMHYEERVNYTGHPEGYTEEDIEYRLKWLCTQKYC